MFLRLVSEKTYGGMWSIVCGSAKERSFVQLENANESILRTFVFVRSSEEMREPSNAFLYMCISAGGKSISLIEHK